MLRNGRENMNRQLVGVRIIADPVARVPPYGAWLWRLRNTGKNLT
jgi:hypothetical protein